MKLDLGYVAGVIDARGYITVNERRPGDATPRVRITTRRVELLTWLANRTGTTVRIDDAGYQRRACSEHCTDRHTHVVRQSAYWNVDGARAVIVLYGCLPYLVQQRTEAHAVLQVAGERWTNGPTEIRSAMRRLGWAIPKRADLP